MAVSSDTIRNIVLVDTVRRMLPRCPPTRRMLPRCPAVRTLRHDASGGRRAAAAAVRQARPARRAQVRRVEVSARRVQPRQERGRPQREAAER